MRAATRLFLLLFGAFSLFNSGYLVASALIPSGDWTLVISGLTPAWAWRVLLAVAGVALYRIALVWVRASSKTLFAGVAHRSIRVATWTAYLSSGVVLTAASTLNPYAAVLILVSGVGASLGINWGLLLAMQPGGSAQDAVGQVFALQRNWSWIVAALVIGALFIAILGPGIRLDPAAVVSR
jgi:hypothetical protein